MSTIKSKSTKQKGPDLLLKTPYQQYFDRRQDLREYLYSLRPTHMMTVNYKRPPAGCGDEQHDYLRQALRRWTVGILYRLYGHKFAKLNAANVFMYLAMTQVGKLLGKRHLHILVRCPFRKWVRFQRFSKSEWPGTTDVKINVLWTLQDKKKAVSYCTRDLLRSPDALTLSNEFRRSKTYPAMVV
jgi:hypothetical protein